MQALGAMALPVALVLLCVACPLSDGRRQAKSVSKEKLMGFVPGDILLGGLFPMHEHNISRREMPCGAIKEEKGIQVGLLLYF